MFKTISLIRLINLHWKDGGGIYRLSSLFILENIIQKIKIIKDYKVEPLSCDYFNIIYSTSTGGYILSIDFKYRNYAEKLQNHCYYVG